MPTPQNPDFAVWDAYFEANTARHTRLDAMIPWQSVCLLPPADVVAIARSLQRFELGESGEGKGLLGKAARRNDPAYDSALVRFIGEEQKHSALFAAALERFGESRLTSHWSDVAFVVLRRMLGLRTEVMLFLIAETTAMEYFGALSRSADPVIHGVARRVLTDEVEHVKFQVDQLRAGFEHTPRAGRMLAAGAAWLVAVGAATVLALDHGPAMRSLGLPPAVFWRRALRQFGRAVPAAFRLGAEAVPFGPAVDSIEYFSGEYERQAPRV
ncbi:para-aminobenzoate N-oxygenase AurF [Subtercola boreus]|nr:para-aminobenzoate N-oxygenase AurF [Subtercola boreus]